MTSISRPITKQDMVEFEATLAEQARQKDALEKGELTEDELLGLVDTQKKAEPEIVPEPKPKFNEQPEDKTDWKKRFSDQTRHFNELKSRTDKEISELKAMVTQLNEKLNAGATDQNDAVIRSFESEFGDVAPVLEAYAKKARIEAERAAQQLIEKANAERDTKAMEDALRREKLSKAHPDWAALKDSEIFNDWYDSQSPAIHKLGASTDVDDVILVLDMFKQQVQPSKQKGSDTKELTQAVKTQSVVEIPEVKKGFSVAVFDKQFDMAQKQGNKVLMAKLLEAYEKAAKENRLTQ